MKTAKGSVLKNFIQFFSMEHKKLRFTEGALELICETALAKGTGARALNSVLELVMNELQFNVLGDGMEEEISINKHYVRSKL